MFSAYGLKLGDVTTAVLGTKAVLSWDVCHVLLECRSAHGPDCSLGEASCLTSGQANLSTVVRLVSKAAEPLVEGRLCGALVSELMFSRCVNLLLT